MYTASGVLCAEEHGALCIQQAVCCVLRNMVHYVYSKRCVVCRGTWCIMYTASGVVCAEEHGALCIQQVVCCVLRNMVHYVYSKWCVVC